MAKKKPAPRKKSTSGATKPSAAFALSGVDVKRIYPPDDVVCEGLESILVTFSHPVKGLRMEHFTVAGAIVEKVVPNLRIDGNQFKRDFEVVLSNVHPSMAITLNGAALGPDAAPRARGTDTPPTFMGEERRNYTVVSVNEDEQVRLLLPDDLWAHVRRMERHDPGLVRSIVRSIFGNQSGSHFGVRKITLEQARAVLTQKKAKDYRPWDKSCL